MITKENKKTFGKIMEIKRYEQGLSQERFAKLLDVERSTLSYWLQGKRFPSPANFKKICDKLNIDIKDIISQ